MQEPEELVVQEVEALEEEVQIVLLQLTLMQQMAQLILVAVAEEEP